MGHFKPRKIEASDFKMDFLILLQVFVALLFISRLFVIQVLNHEKYKALAYDQYWSLQEIPAKRGDILSSDGYPLATTQIAYLLYALPDQIENPEKVSLDLANQVINLNPDLYKDENEKQAVLKSFKERYLEILKLDLKWVVLEHYLSEEERRAISDLQIAGIGFEDEPRRYYPEGTLSSHVLGFVAKNEKGEEQGYFGIEGAFNGDLMGKPGKVFEERDATGAPILVGGHTTVDPINGRDVYLTVNRAVQYLVERKLTEGVKKYEAISGSVIVMDPLTGDVIAMANFPTFDPANFNDLGIAKPEIGDDPIEEKDGEEKQEYNLERRNLAISETYEPGSVIKGLTISTGIDLKKITPSSTFDDRGPVNYSGYTIDNWDGKHHGVQDIYQLLQKSNNIGSAWVGHVVGSKSLHKYFSKFGLGELTLIDLEGEDTGIIRDYEDWTDIDLSTAAFGQGISATPLQILNAFNAIANDGVLLKPRIVTKIVQNEKTIEIPVKEIQRVISKDSSKTMIDLLTSAVAGGESKFFNIKNYKIAGKTGTAQIPVGGKYDPQKTNATFVGFLAGSKKFSMIVRLDRPSSSVYAAETAVPLWMDIAKDLINFYGIYPDNPIQTKQE